MIRNLRALGLALLAIGAMGAVAASAAQAESNAQVTTESSPAVIDGQQIGIQKLTRGAVPITCETATFAATVNNGDTTSTVTPTYSGCHATGPFGETWPVTATMNGCNFLLHLTADFINNQHTYTSITTLKCPAGSQVVIHLYTSHNNHTANNPLCTFSDPEQNVGGHIHFTNKAAGGSTPKNWIEANLTITNVTSNREGSGLCGAAHHTTGQIHGGAELKGTTAGGLGNGITVSTDV